MIYFFIKTPLNIILTMLFDKFEINNLDDLLNIIKTSDKNIFKMKPSNDIGLYMLAAKYGYLDIVIFMTETLKYNINEIGDKGDTALTYAMFGKQPKVVNYFLDNHFDEINFDQKDKFGNNLLLSSVYSDDPAVFDRVYDTGKFDLKSKNNKGNDFLGIAAATGSLNIMKHLFEKYNWKVDNINELYLMTVRNKQLNILKYLDETQEINVFYTDNSNKTALDYAMELKEDKGITEYIKLRFKKAGDELIKLKKKFTDLKKMNF